MDPFAGLHYELPADLIAQQPTQRRSDSRLMHIRRATGEIEHLHFRDLPTLLKSGDQLVTNDSRVLPARVIAERVNTGGRVEVLYLGSDESGMWQCLVRARGRLQPMEPLMLKDREGREALKLWLLEKRDGGVWTAHLEQDEPAVDVLERIGRIPLPPYIRDGMENDDDHDRYQTVYAKHPGSVAAPTAGLHFTPDLLRTLATQGIPRHAVTLHVGADTFKPVQTNNLDEHPMHSEWGRIDESTAVALQAARQTGGRIIAVGTTSVRVLESAAATGTLQAWTGQTRLFIRPPYQFRAVDGLITNFHLPRTTLLLLVASLMGEELTQYAYRTAIREGYRFYSYGDAMFID